MTIDCGKQGSIYYFNSPQQSRIATSYLDSVCVRVYQKLVGTSVADWDLSFDDIASHKSPGYIAILQKHLAAQRTCLVQAGMGTFQETTHTMYNQKHTGKQRCYEYLQLRFCWLSYLLLGLSQTKLSVIVTPIASLVTLVTSPPPHPLSIITTLSV